MVPSLTPYEYDPFPQNGVPYVPMIREWPCDSIHFMFGSRVGFSGSADRMALFRVYQIQGGGRPPSWKIFNGRISANGHAIHFMLRFYGIVFRASPKPDSPKPILPNLEKVQLFCGKKSYSVSSITCLVRTICYCNSEQSQRS